MAERTHDRDCAYRRWLQDYPGRRIDQPDACTCGGQRAVEDCFLCGHAVHSQPCRTYICDAYFGITYREVCPCGHRSPLSVNGVKYVLAADLTHTLTCREAGCGRCLRLREVFTG